jgi:hypothetical protein
MRNEDPKQPELIYVKPRLEKVRLMTNETLDAYCRSISVTVGPTGGTTACSGALTPCLTPL